MPCSTPKREFQKRRVTQRQSPVPNNAKKQVGKFYRPRDHETSPFFKVVRDHFDEFERVYPEKFQTKYGYWRPIIRTSIDKFLKCGDLKEGLSASFLLRKVFRLTAVLKL
jgi:hypothetical protein